MLNLATLSAVIVCAECGIYMLLAGATWHCPGHYIKIIKCIVRAKVAW
jgi:hypothetical protein